MNVEMTPDDLIEQFFSPPNLIWPSADPASPVAATIQPFLASLADRGECPVVLPRRSNLAKPTVIYVVCWDIAHAGRVRPLLEAAVAHHWCRFDGRVAQLDAADPVDGAVLDFVGPGTTFILRPTKETANSTFAALSRLVETIGDRPLRVPKVPRPIGRMLKEFDLALASGAAESSERLLREIKTIGGVSHENVAFLEIRRLFQLGRDRELLEHRSLPTMIYVDPPRLVREGVLAAWARLNLPRPLPVPDVDGALTAIEAAKPDVAMLVDEVVAQTADPDVSTVCALVAIVREQSRLQAALAQNPTVDPSVRERLTAASQDLIDDADLAPETQIPELLKEPEAPAVVTTPIESWLDWVDSLDSEASPSLESGQTLDWAPAWEVDSQLAEAIDALPEVATDDLIAGVAAIIEADDQARPAAQTAAALVRRYLLAERFSPFDLGATCALLEIFLRSGPPSDAYRQMLDDVRDFSNRWVSVANATRAIDLADTVVCGPVSDANARTSFVTSLLAPLNQQKRRLSGTLRELAGLVTDDLDLGYDWAVLESETLDQDHGWKTASSRILLYSLDTGALARVKKAIDLQWPNVKVEISSDLDGNPALKQHARNADLIVLATRRATHAATGFITANAESALIKYPDGSGSASMLRSVEAGFGELAK